MTRILGLARGFNSYVMGDFNVDLLKSSVHEATSDFLGGFTTSGFYPLISLPTRLTDSTATLIDNIWTNNVTARIDSGLVTVRVSDHLPVFSFVGGKGNGEEMNHNNGKRRLVNERRIRRFAEQLEIWSFDEVRALPIEDNVARFRNEFRDLYDKEFPWKEDKRSKRDREKPWLDEVEFKGLIEEKGELYGRKLSGRLNEQEQLRLRAVNKEVNQLRRKLKRDYFEQRLAEKLGDLRATWETIGEAIQGRRGKNRGVTCRYFQKEGKAITEGAEIASGFCEFYCKVGPKLAAKIPKERDGAFKDYLGDRIDESLILSPTTPSEIEELCLALEPGKGMGWEGFSPRVIKGVAKELSGSLSRLYNSCIREGYYPGDFKIARVVPVFKAEDPTEFSNYRPVSVLPVLSQLFERVIQKRLVHFLDRNKVTIPGQYGFRAGHSTAMAVLDMVEKVRGAWGRGNIALGVFIDLKKAFDTVDHEILLDKLEHYGIRGTAQGLLRSYLSKRSQYVTYGGHESERGEIECGVPQGSVLGPLFFLLYVNDMVKAAKGLDFVLFADDTNIFIEGKNSDELVKRVKEGLEGISRWFQCNRLTLNLKKTVYSFSWSRFKEYNTTRKS